jgi:glycine cleavage system H protein
MDGYSYVDIFETKGIEYIVIIAFLLLLIPFSILLNKKAKSAREFKRSFNPLSFNQLKIPNGIFFSKNHTWAHLERSGLAKIGLNQLMYGFAGNLDINPLRYSNEMIRKGDVLAEIGLNGKRLRVFSPVSGRIIKANPRLDREITELPAMNGEQDWLFEIQPTDWKSETSNYLLAEEAAAWFKSELERLKDFLAMQASRYSPELSMAVLQDGGELHPDLIEALPHETWKEFQKEFLDPEEDINQSL